MHSNRGILGALGASGSLIAAAACCLLLVSAVVAQRGWPGMDSSVPAIQMVTAQRVPDRNPAVAVAAVPKLRVSSAPTARRPASTSRVASNRPGTGPSSFRRQPNAGTITPPSSSNPAPPSSPPKSAGKTGSGASGTAGSVVQKVTDGVGAAAPPLATAVKGVGDALGTTLDNTTKTLGQAGAAVGQIVQGVLGGVAGVVHGLLAPQTAK